MNMQVEEYTETPGHDALHLWFSLSYAQYLLVPRSLMQSMPDEWQGQMAELLQQMDEKILQHKIEWPRKGYSMEIRMMPDSYFDDNGRYEVLHVDDLADYERGRRRLWNPWREMTDEEYDQYTRIVCEECDDNTEDDATPIARHRLLINEDTHAIRVKD